jgi:hypothetical protein
MEESSKYLIKELKEERYFKEQYKLNTIDMNDYFAYSGKGEYNEKLSSLMPDYRMKKINNDMSKYVLKDYNKK